MVDSPQVRSFDAIRFRADSCVPVLSQMVNVAEAGRGPTSDWKVDGDELLCSPDEPSSLRTPRSTVATAATRDLNATVYECIGLSDPKLTRLLDLLAELRASGKEFDIEHSDEVIEEVGSRQAHKRGRGGRNGGFEVA